jgi:hypothetical protein
MAIMGYKSLLMSAAAGFARKAMVMGRAGAPGDFETGIDRI